MKNSGETKLFLGILAVAAVLVFFAFKPMLFPPKQEETKDPPPPQLTAADLVPPGSRVRGDAKAPYTLVEFGDYQCPQCQTAVGEVDKLMKKYPTKLKYVFNYTSVVPREQHPFSELLAMAAEAADKQGKFWEMHHELFNSQYKFARATQEQVQAEIIATGTKLGLDAIALKSDMAGADVDTSIERQKHVGVKAKVNLTPWFYVIRPDGTPLLIKRLQDMKDWGAKPENLK